MGFFSQALEMVNKVEESRGEVMGVDPQPGEQDSWAGGQFGVAYAEYFKMYLWGRWG